AAKGLLRPSPKMKRMPPRSRPTAETRKSPARRRTAFLPGSSNAASNTLYLMRPNGWAFSGEPSERSERPERRRGRRVRCNAMLGSRWTACDEENHVLHAFELFSRLIDDSARGAATRGAKALVE